MHQAVLTAGAALLAAAIWASDEQPRAGYARKDGLSLTASLDKASYGPDDAIVLRFVLKNETDQDRFVGDGFLAPDYQEVGPGQHFEVHVKASGKDALSFWSGMMTEGITSGIRKVFKIRPGEAYKGAIRLSAGRAKDAKYAELPHGQRGGSFEDKTSGKKHVLGVGGRKYTIELRYQVNPKSHGVWEPPADFKDKLLWTGELITTPLEFEVARD